MRAVGLAWMAGGALLAQSACGEEFESAPEEPPPPCWEDPWVCPASQTCWFDTETSMKCLNQGDGRDGAPCMGLYPTVECAHGHVCLLTMAAPGFCTPYCSLTDPDHPCPTGLLCTEVHTANPEIIFFACVP